MKRFNLGLGIVLAALSLAAAPAFAQKPDSGSSGGPAAGGGAVDRSTGGGGPAGGGGGAVDRGSGGASSAGSSGSASSSGGGGSDFSSPSSSAISSPGMSFGGRAARESAPGHRPGFSGRTSYTDDGQKATPRSSGPSGGGGGGGSAVTRGGGGSSGGGSSSNGGGARSGSGDGSPSRAAGRPSAETNAGSNNTTGTREVPSWSRPRGDRPTTGTAVDRVGPPPDRDGGHHGRYGYPYYDPFYGYGYGGYGYNSYYYPYGFGLGYGLYSGFGWAPYYGDPMGDPYGYGGGSYSSSYGRGEQGNLKLKVKPRSAKVYVDGYFVGYVDQFDGSFQKLALNTGRHKVEVKADGFETAEFDVLINPEQTVTFQGELKRIQ